MNVPLVYEDPFKVPGGTKSMTGSERSGFESWNFVALNGAHVWDV